MLHRLVCDGELPQVATHHLTLSRRNKGQQNDREDGNKSTLIELSIYTYCTAVTP